MFQVNAKNSSHRCHHPRPAATKDIAIGAAAGLAAAGFTYVAVSYFSDSSAKFPQSDFAFGNNRDQCPVLTFDVVASMAAKLVWNKVVDIGKLYLSSRVFTPVLATVVCSRMHSSAAEKKPAAPQQNSVSVKKAHIKNAAKPVQHDRSSSVAALSSNKASSGSDVVVKQKPKQLSLKDQFGDCSNKAYKAKFVALCEKLLPKCNEEKATTFLNDCIKHCDIGKGIKSDDVRKFIDGVEDKILALQHSLV